MRKSRGLTLDKKRWVYGWIVKCDDKFYIAEKVKDTHWDLCAVFAGFIEVIPETVGQSTGLKDKNGKEIYFDSDIVNYTYTSDCGGHEEEFTITGIVVLDLKHTNSICVLEKRNGRTGGLYHFTAGEFRNIEIIGNVHSNPDLLENNR